ncbi:hypothetical protein D3C81_2172280 [compost metagenome]
MVDAPCHGIDVEDRTRGFGLGIKLGRQQAGAPQTVVLLQFAYAPGHGLEDVDVVLTTFEVGGHGFQRAG